jgi:glutamate synthase (NADPH/NADH) large chain
MESEHHHGGDIEHHGRVDISKDMTRFDDERLRSLIENHLKYTRSDRAEEILASWDAFRPKFVKVMPTEYRRALLEIQQVQIASGYAAE